VNPLLRPLVALFSLAAAVPVLAQSFYEARFQSGVADFSRGAYARASDELRVAAFGRIDDIPSYITAEVYLAVANDRLEHAEDARLAAVKVLQAERISPSYAALKLPPDVRASFEQLLTALLTRDQLASVPAFARLASQAPAVQSGAPRPTRRTTTVPTPSKQPNVAVTVQKNDDKVESQPPQPALDYGRLALERVAAGDEAGARRYGDLAFAADDTNANAHAALAQISRAHNAWSNVAEHYAIVRTRRHLTDDETAAYLIALVKIGRVADAMGVRRTASNAVLARPDVRDALQSIEPKPVPQPQPVAPQPTAPAPVPAPAPQPPPTPARATPAPVPAPIVPLVVPHETTAGSDEPILEQVADAEGMIGSGNIVGARTQLRRIASLPNLQRSDRQALARALSQAALYAESSAQYRKTYPLKAGEETHMFYEAVNRFELGDYGLARQLITRAMPALPQTPAVLAYRDRILAQQ
jgi:outer membrane biosynthesis protein TonB